MANGIAHRIKRGRRSMLVIAAIATIVAPLIAGIQNASLDRAQSLANSHDAAFEAVSIRPSSIWKAGGEGSSRSKIEFAPNSLTMRNVDLNECVQWAYGVQSYRISGLHLSAERYDILARAEGSVPVHQLEIMLQDLLAKRFNLKLHQEAKMLGVYELVVAKGGPRLPAPKAGEISPSHASESLPRVEDGNFVFRDISMPELAEKLSQLREIDRPVVDRTGIKGLFDITLKGAASAMLQPDGPSLFTLIQEQLGLKLVSTKAPVDVLVIDYAEKPSVN
jgi:bla regulator protein blaR1